VSRPRIRQVRASAGSGKTYALTARFLELLDAAKAEDPGMACRGVRPESYSWPEILAVTFTNKAAAEMKERVLTALKRCALGLTSGGQRADWDPRRAAKVVETVLRRYHRLNIRTIDSLLVLLLRLFALDYGLRPDFQVALEEDELFGPAYERFVDACADPHGPQRALLVSALTTFLGFENRAGFSPERGIRERLFELTGHLQAEPGGVLADQEEMARILDRCREEFLQVVAVMQGHLEEFALAPRQHFKNFLGKCQALSGFDEPPDSAYADKPCLAECLTQAGIPNVTGQCERAYAMFKTAWAAFRREWAALEGAYALAPALGIARELLGAMRDEAQRQGVVPMSSLSAAVHGLLTRDEAVPEAYCRLGSRLHHLLVDEFQDTSRAQWSALEPLARECLAKGGSLFCVGDVKQAIYSWRGGDASLFDQLRDRPGLADLTGGADLENLPRNWRSAPAVVDWNNAFFERLADPGTAQELADRCLDKAPDEERAALARDITAAFADARQDLPAERTGPEGFVRLTRLPGGSAEEARNAALDALETLIQDLGQRRPWRDLAVLVRDNRQAGLVCERLVALDIPVITEKSLLLARHPVVRQLAALLAFLDFPADDLAFLTLVTGPLFQKAAGLAPEAVTDWLMGQKPGNLGFKFREAFPQVWADRLKPFFDRAGLLTPYDLAQAAVQRLRILERNPDAELHVRRFLEVVHLAEGNGCRSLSAFLDYWRDQGAEEQVPLPENLDAVRVLTMHKAKGLEFPVVLVPFHHWRLQPQDGFAVLDVQDRRVLTPLRAALGPEYRERVGREIREQLHLLYVAWTRACEEFYGFYPAREGDAKRPPALAALDLLLDPDQAVLERGRQDPGSTQKRAPAETPRPVPAVAPGEELTSWLPRLRIFRHALEDVFEDQRRRGEMAHRALELLRPTGDDAADALRAARLALLDFPAAAPEREADIAALLRWVLAQPELKACLGQGLAEAEALDAEGQNIRCDRLVLREGEALVLEYKTGRPDPEHETQVRRYLELAAGLRPRARGLLVYLDRREVREVTHG
jgi:ATP-dependent exoDNAse (exonuclease V) beta subunit